LQAPKRCSLEGTALRGVPPPGSCSPLVVFPAAQPSERSNSHVVPENAFPTRKSVSKLILLPTRSPWVSEITFVSFPPPARVTSHWKTHLTGFRHFPFTLPSSSCSRCFCPRVETNTPKYTFAHSPTTEGGAGMRDQFKKTNARRRKTFLDCLVRN